MRTDISTKRTIVKSILFIIVFWLVIGTLMYGLFHLFHALDLTELVSRVLEG